MHPVVFHQWFLRSFPEPSAWYDARVAYTRTSAVMSMVGLITGLGDRHGENILFDSRTGETVHVDLSAFGWFFFFFINSLVTSTHTLFASDCLFWKGQSFAVPEKVPYRLTRNMVDAMGVTGAEGTFRRTCELTLQLLRANSFVSSRLHSFAFSAHSHGSPQRDSLMSVLESFIYDPFIEWTSPKKQTVRPSLCCLLLQSQRFVFIPLLSQAADAANFNAVEKLTKLAGILSGKQEMGMPMSVEGQVDHSIATATSTKNLSEMYIGWAPWL